MRKVRGERDTEDGEYGYGSVEGGAVSGAFQVERKCESFKTIANKLF